MESPKQFVAMQECSTGNASVGTEWIEAASFPPTATLAEVWAWAKASNSMAFGKLMLTDDKRA